SNCAFHFPATLSCAKALPTNASANAASANIFVEFFIDWFWLNGTPPANHKPTAEGRKSSGARPSGRFNVRGCEQWKNLDPCSVRRVKRRERRAPGLPQRGCRRGRVVGCNPFRVDHFLRR